MRVVGCHDAARPPHVGFAGREACLDDRDLSRVDAELPAHAEVVSQAGLAAKALNVGEGDVDAVDRTQDAGGPGVQDELRAGQQQLLSVATRGQAEVGREVDGPKHEPHDARGAGDCVGLAQPGGRLDERIDGLRPAAQRLQALRRGLGQHQPSDVQAGEVLEVRFQQTRERSVDPHHQRLGVRLALGHGSEGAPPLGLRIGRYAILEVRDHRPAVSGERLRELDLVAGGSEQVRAGRRRGQGDSEADVRKHVRMYGQMLTSCSCGRRRLAMTRRPPRRRALDGRGTALGSYP